MWAAAEGHAEVVEALIAAGADFRDAADLRVHALAVCGSRGKEPTLVRSLLKAGLDINEPVPAPPKGTKRLRGARHRIDSACISLLQTLITNSLRSCSTLGADPNAIGPGTRRCTCFLRSGNPGGGDNDPSPEGSGTHEQSRVSESHGGQGANLNARNDEESQFRSDEPEHERCDAFLLAARTRTPN